MFPALWDAHRDPEAEQLWNSSCPGLAQVPDSSHHMIIQHMLPRQFPCMLIVKYKWRHHSTDYNVDLINFQAKCICFGLWISTGSAKCTLHVQQKCEAASASTTLPEPQKLERDIKDRFTDHCMQTGIGSFESLHCLILSLSRSLFLTPGYCIILST